MAAPSHPSAHRKAGRARWRYTAGLLLLTLLALALRVHRLEAQSLWYDEGVTAEIAQRSFMEITRWTARDIQPPLYYYVVSLWGKALDSLGPAAAAWSEWSLRFPSVVFGTLTVPLLAAVAHALTRDRRIALLAALLATLHPLLLYYSQEARMYAMLTALGVLAGYFVVRSAEFRVPSWRTWGAYVLAATAAVYTHYFAFFLLLALAVATLLDGARQRRLRRTWRPLLSANLLVLLLYAPWLVPLITQLSVDASYWEGTLKVDEALRSIAIRFSGGETVLEAHAIWLLVPTAIVTLAAMAALLLQARIKQTGDVSPCTTHHAPHRTLLYALCWLIIPVAAILLLATWVPKFNPRYVMVALPGLLLLWSGGLIGWFDLARRMRALLRPIAFAFGTVLLVALLAIFVYADRNWFVNPAFTKAQWRELTTYVRQHKAPDEAVILVSGHAWPVWEYYAGDIPAARLPPLEILDVNAVLDYAQSARLLGPTLADQRGAWYVGWQDEVVDPMGVTRLHLARSGEATPVDQPFWQLDLYHYTKIKSAAIQADVPEFADGPVNFGNQLQLLGYTQLPDDELVLFWRLHPDHAAPPADYRIHGQLRTANSLPYATLADRRPAGFNYPAFRWRPDDIAVSRIPAADWAAPRAAPGAYSLRLGVYDPTGDPSGLDVLGVQGQPLGKTTALALQLSRPTSHAEEGAATAATSLSPSFTLTATLATTTAEPGQPVQLDLTWFVQETPPHVDALHARWVDAAGAVAAQETLPLQPPFFTSQWPANSVLRTVHRVRPPLSLEPGAYVLKLASSPSESDELALPFRVLPSTRAFQPPRLAQRVDARFGEQLALLGTVEPLPQQLAVGEPFTVTLAWQALANVSSDYAVTVQLLDAQGAPRAQADLALPDGSSSWLPDQVEVQPFTLTAPPPPGDYWLIVAVYDPQQAGLPRLGTTDGADAVELAAVTVIPAAAD